MFPSKEKNLITCVYLFKLMPLNIYIFFFYNLDIPLSVFFLFQSLQKNGQISSMTSLNGHSEDNTLAEGTYVCVCVCVSYPSVVFIYSVWLWVFLWSVG